VFIRPINEAFHAGLIYPFYTKSSGRICEPSIVLGQLLGDSLMIYRYTFCFFFLSDRFPVNMCSS